MRKEFKEEDCYKGIKWSLYKRPEKYDEEGTQLLQKAFEKSWLLEEIYELRNTFNSMFDIASTAEELNTQLDYWIEHATALKNKFIDPFVKTLERWKKPIVAFASKGITNAATEGLNNYLPYFKHISFGLPNFEHMRLRILVATG